MKLFIGVGIDRYNTGITPLCGAANDVRYLGMVFEQLGFERVILTDEDMRAGRSVSSTLEEQVRRLGDGDLLVFFFAGHGKTVTSPQPDQLLLLHDVTRRSLDAGFTNNTLSLRQIALETSQPGLQRVLIIDACRMPIEQEKADSRDAGDAIQFAGEAIFRDVARRAPRKTELNDRLSPVAVLNSCSDGQRAMEIKTERRGLYALTLQKVMQEARERGKPIVLDSAFDADVERAMDILAAKHQLDRGQQKPVRQGEDVRLYGLEDSRNNEIRQLLARFEEQLARHALDTPWNDNCRDTLAMLGAKGLPFEEQQTLRQRLQAAVEARDASHREQEWATQCGLFERQLAAGRLDAPFDDNCSDTLRQLRELRLPEERLNELRLHLQNALDTRHQEADRAYDENLITLARQTPSKTLYLNYLNQSRLHEYDQEARDFLTSADLGDEETRLWSAAKARPGLSTWQAYLDHFPQGSHAGEARQNLARLAQAEFAAAQTARDAKRQQEAEQVATLNAWQACKSNAETDSLRQRADNEIRRLQDREYEASAALKRDQQAAQAAHAARLPRSTWLEFATKAETDWGRAQAHQNLASLKAADQQGWQAACKQDTEQAYAAYLASQAEGEQRDEAESRLLARSKARLAREEQEQNTQQELAAWRKASSTTGSPEKCRLVIEEYLATWPQGAHIQEALTLLATLKNIPPPEPGKWKKSTIAMAIVAVIAGSVTLPKLFTRETPVLPVAPEAKNEANKPTPEKIATKNAASLAPANSAPTKSPEESWLEKTTSIEGSNWWTRGSPMSASEQQWVKETLTHATTDKWPKAQMQVALLHCSGIAAPLVARDTRACGEWLSTSLNNPALPTGKERDDIENDVSRLFDIRVTPKSGSVDTGFAQAIAPGLGALRNDYPGSAVRLAYIQACYLNPVDRNAAKATLNGVVQSFARQPEATNARKMLADLESGKIGWCRK